MQLIADSQVMRCRITLRTTLFALMATPSLLTVLAAAVPAHAEDTPFISIVTGLAPDDLLNIRAKPSPIGKTETRLAAGASVRNLGCNDINGHPWCKVESDNPKATGWAPARYLVPVNPAAVTDAGTETSGDDAAALPDLTKRLGEADQAVDAEAEPKSTDAIARTAIEDAYRLAFAANDSPDSASAPDAAGGIPCARDVGQPMTRCSVSVAHKDSDSTVTVTWPDGGTRVITFHGGKPAGSDSSDEFRFTREGTLNLIRVGVSERFEITDTVAFGDQAVGSRQ
ncbi:SH3 domain-containing protein [Mesorhizobium erdmanii]|nr:MULTISPECIES: SH3 domain-containing protein [Mesorhizobium]